MFASPADLPDDWSTLWYLVRRVAGLMDRTGEALFRSELDISLAQYLVLSVVDAHPGQLNQQAVADRLGLTKGTISRQIESAVAAGLMTVDVSPHSRRENAVALTAAGRDVVRRGDDLFQSSREVLLSAVDKEEMAAAIRTLAVLNEKLDPPSARPREGRS
jgi:DNA-binding MarR family transcriptional regulator